MALVSDGSSAGEQGSEGAVGQGDGVGLDDDVAMQFGVVVEVGLRVVLDRVEVVRTAEGIGQGSAAVGVCDYDDGGGGLPGPFVIAEVDRMGVPVVGSVESMTPSVPVINGIPSASIAHIAATGG